MRMNAKDTVVGTAKKLVAEIVGDGKLAEEGARQAGGRDPLTATNGNDGFIPVQRESTPSDIPISQASPLHDEDRFARLLGHAALKVWSDLPREAQERLFAAPWTMASSRTPSRFSCTVVIRKRRTRRCRR
jgi:hypothetical protein